MRPHCRIRNVKINASGYKDKTYTDDIISQGQELELKTIVLEAEIIELVNSKI
jgi:glutamate formiminotransferase/formiminotetrahydrofolate cyclodeaminase